MTSKPPPPGEQEEIPGRNFQESPKPVTTRFGAKWNCADIQSSSQRAKGRVIFEIQV